MRSSVHENPAAARPRWRLLHTDVLDPRRSHILSSHPRLAAVRIPVEQLSERSHELPSGDLPLRVLDEGPECQAAIAALLQLGRRAIPIPLKEAPLAADSALYRLWKPTAFLEESIVGVAAGTATDLACGTGRDAVYLAAEGWHVCGIDWLPDALDRARLRERSATGAIPHPVVWRSADLEAPDTTLEPAELVTMFRFLDRGLLSRVGRFVAPGGMLLIETFTSLQRERHGRPRREQFVLEPGELPSLVPDLEVVRFDEGWRAEGSHTARLCAVARGTRNSTRPA